MRHYIYICPEHGAVGVFDKPRRTFFCPDLDHMQTLAPVEVVPAAPADELADAVETWHDEVRLRKALAAYRSASEKP